MKTASKGFDNALNKYPKRMNGARFPSLSERFPKYPLLKPAVASANPSNIPINKTEKPMDFRYTGIIGYNISLAMSVKKLTNETNRIARVIIFLFILHCLKKHLKITKVNPQKPTYSKLELTRKLIVYLSKQSLLLQVDNRLFFHELYYSFSSDKEISKIFYHIVPHFFCFRSTDLQIYTHSFYIINVSTSI